MAQSKDMSDFSKKMIVQKEFICKICNNLLRVPIILVANVGNVCNKCFDEKKDAMGYTGQPNKALDAVIMETVQAPCKFAAAGCTEIVPYKSYKQHSLICLYRNTDCPIKHGCQWKGIVNDSIRHINQEHPEMVYKSDKNSIPFKLNLNSLIETKKVLKYKERYYFFRIHVKQLTVEIALLTTFRLTQRYVLEVKLSNPSNPIKAITKQDFVHTDKGYVNPVQFTKNEVEPLKDPAGYVQVECNFHS